MRTDGDVNISNTPLLGMDPRERIDLVLACLRLNLAQADVRQSKYVDGLDAFEFWETG